MSIRPVAKVRQAWSSSLIRIFVGSGLVGLISAAVMGNCGLGASIFLVTLVLTCILWLAYEAIRDAIREARHPGAGHLLRAAPTRRSSSDPYEMRLARATNYWTLAVLIRSYQPGDAGLAEAQHEANILVRHGYELFTQTALEGHLNVGRTVTGAVATGGLNLLFGGSRTRGQVTITYRHA